MVKHYQGGIDQIGEPVLLLNNGNIIRVGKALEELFNGKTIAQITEDKDLEQVNIIDGKGKTRKSWRIKGAKQI